MRAAEVPDKSAIIFYGREISYRELDEASDRFANYLRQNGVKKGDRVAIFMGNCPSTKLPILVYRNWALLSVPAHRSSRKWS